MNTDDFGKLQQQVITELDSRGWCLVAFGIMQHGSVFTISIEGARVGGLDQLNKVLTLESGVSPFGLEGAFVLYNFIKEVCGVKL